MALRPSSPFRRQCANDSQQEMRAPDIRACAPSEAPPPRLYPGPGLFVCFLVFSSVNQPQTLRARRLGAAASSDVGVIITPALRPRPLLSLVIVHACIHAHLLYKPRPLSLAATFPTKLGQSVKGASITLALLHFTVFYCCNCLKASPNLRLKPHSPRVE